MLAFLLECSILWVLDPDHPMQSLSLASSCAPSGSEHSPGPIYQKPCLVLSKVCIIFLGRLQAAGSECVCVGVHLILIIFVSLVIPSTVPRP